LARKGTVVQLVDRLAVGPHFDGVGRLPSTYWVGWVGQLSEAANVPGVSVADALGRAKSSLPASERGGANESRSRAGRRA
jgi:hypothetical protein